MRPGGVAAKNVVNTFLAAEGGAAYHAAIKRFLNPFIKKQYYSSKCSSAWAGYALVQWYGCSLPSGTNCREPSSVVTAT